MVRRYLQLKNLQVGLFEPMKRRLEVEPDFYSQEVDDILDALDDFSDGFSDHEGESSQPEEVQPSKNVKSSTISEIKEEILKEKRLYAQSSLLYFQRRSIGKQRRIAVLFDLNLGAK